MTLDGDLREVLTTWADRVEGPTPDITAIRNGGLRIRRRRRRVVVASSALAALLAVGAGFGITEGLRDTSAADVPAGPPGGVGTATEVPWCVGPDSSGGQRIVGEGAPIGTLCEAGRDTHMWHQAGTTLLSRQGTVELVSDRRLVPLGTGDVVSMSHDGLLAAALSSPSSNCGLLLLEVYDVATATRIAATDVEAVSCGHLVGMDDRGRVYLTVHDEAWGTLDVRMYDTRRREWIRVGGLPAEGTRITYVTADGFAVQSEEIVVTSPGYGDALPLASVEGRVDDAGRFRAQREVPIGRGRWSLDRSLVVDQRPDGVVVRRADLSTTVTLDLPTAPFTASASRLPDSDLLWESPTVVLVVGDRGTSSPVVYRCDVRSGSCAHVDRPGRPALGNNTQPGG